VRRNRHDSLYFPELIQKAPGYRVTIPAFKASKGPAAVDDEERGYPVRDGEVRKMSGERFAPDNDDIRALRTEKRRETLQYPTALELPVFIRARFIARALEIGHEESGDAYPGKSYSERVAVGECLGCDWSEGTYLVTPTGETAEELSGDNGAATRVRGKRPDIEDTNAVAEGLHDERSARGHRRICPAM
jgi:hypothetical protein